ncbi:MAG: hypothetical protein Q8R24_06955 [Legionellaceae bacterium]|nr:hypothetical protein [Legionellaceae bacterium]
MTIELNGQCYQNDQIEELFDELRSNHVSRKVILVCHSDRLAPDIRSLLDSIESSDPPLPCRVQLVTIVNEHKILHHDDLLETLYFKGKRKQFSNDMIAKIVRAEGGSAPHVQKPYIDKSILNLFGSAGGDKPEIAVQQQQQQQQQQAQKQDTTITKPRIAHKRSEAIPSYVDPKEPNTIITRENIMRDNEVLAFYNQNFQNLAEKPSLLAIWDNLVGERAIYIADKRKTITGVERDAMIEVIRHYKEFGYGVVSDNLPVMMNESGEIEARFTLEETGYGIRNMTSNPTTLSIKALRGLLEDHVGYIQYSNKIYYFNKVSLQEVPELKKQQLQPMINGLEADKLYIKSAHETHDPVERVLCYTTHCSQEEKDDKSALTITLSRHEIKPSLGSYIELCSVDSAISANDVIIHEQVLQRTTSSDESITNAFHFFLASGTETRVGLINQRLNSLRELNKVRLNANFYRGLTNLLVSAGDAGVLLFLNYLIHVKDITLIDKFLEEPLNYLQFASKEGFEKLEQISRSDVEKGFSPAQQDWWKTLVCQHSAAGARLDFNDLFKAFTDSMSILQIGPNNVLPEKCPFEHDIKHMKTALARFVYVVKPHVVTEEASNDPSQRNQQLDYLRGLDLGPLGAEFGVRHEGLNIVTEQTGASIKQGVLLSDGKPQLSYSMHDDVTFAKRMMLSSDNKKVKVDLTQETDTETHDVRCEDSKIFFYQYICGQSQIFPLESYDNIVKYVESLTDQLMVRKENEFSALSLSEESRVSMLYTLAMASAGKRACVVQPKEPFGELPDYIEALREYSKKIESRRGDGLEYALKCMHQSGFQVETSPTLGELTTILNLMPASSDARLAKELFPLTLRLIKHYGAAAYDVMKHHKERLAKQTNAETADKTSTITAINFPVFVKALDAIYSTSEAAFLRDQPVLFQRFVTVLSLLNDSIEDQVAYERDVKLLMTQLHDLPKPVYSALLTQLCDIDLEASEGLPTFASLGLMISEIKNSHLMRGCDLVLMTVSSQPTQQQLHQVWSANDNKPILCKRSSGILRTQPDYYFYGKSGSAWNVRHFDNQTQKDWLDNLPLPFPSDQASPVQAFDYDFNIKPIYDAIIENHWHDDMSIDDHKLPLDALNQNMLTSLDATHTAYGKKEFEELPLDFISMFQEFALKYDLKNCQKTLETYAEKLGMERVAVTACGGLIRETVAFYDLLVDEKKQLRARDDVNPEAVLDQLQKLDDVMNRLLTVSEILIYPIRTRLIKLIQGGMLGGAEKAVLPDFFDQKTLKVFLGALFDNEFKLPMEASVRVLKGPKTFRDFLMKQLVLNNTSQITMRESIRLYKARQGVLNKFINQLGALQNQNKAEYLKCVELLNNEQNQIVLTMDDLSRIFQVVPTQKKWPISKQLACIFEELKKTNRQSNQSIPDARLTNIINGLNVLVEEQEKLTPAVVKLLFKASFTHNLDSDNPFPLQAMLDLQKSDSSGQLFKQFINVVSLVSKFNSSDSAARTLLSTVSVLEKQATTLPSLKSFVSLLLKNINLNGCCCARVMLSEPTEADKNKVLSLNEVLIIRSKDVYEMAFCNLDGKYERKVIADNSVRELLAQYNSVGQYIINDDHEQQLNAVLHSFKSKSTLNRLPLKSEQSSYDDLLKKIPSDPEIAEQWLTILVALGESRQNPPDLKQLNVIAVLLEDEAKLKTIHTLFKTPPYPPIGDFMEVMLSKEHNALENYKHEFDLRPYSTTCAKEIDNNFILDPVSISRVVGGMTQYLDNQGISEEKQANLVKQLCYVNAIGRGDYPLLGIKDGQPVSYKLKEMSRAELLTLVEEIKACVRADQSPKGDRKLQLHLLAVLRELYCRGTSKNPNSTQLLSILLSLEHPTNVLLQIDTGEGKSVTTALFAAMRCAKGRTVHVPTANRTLVSQDYHVQQNKYFFTLAGMKSAVVESGSVRHTHQVGGINYGTFGDLSIYRSTAKLFGESLTTDDQGRFFRTDVVLDEADKILDDRKQYNYSMEKEGGGDLYFNPNEWMYYEILNFVASSLEFQRVEADADGNPPWNQEERIRQVKIYLESGERTSEQRRQVGALDRYDLDIWIISVCDALRINRGRDYAIPLEPTKRMMDGEEVEVNIVTPVDANGVPQDGASYLEGRHQFLHAFLSKGVKHGTEKFKAILEKRNGVTGRYPIDAETMCVATESADAYLTDYLDDDHGGDIIALTGTTGTKDERLELYKKYNLLPFEIPPHKKSNRKPLPPQVVENTNNSNLVRDKAIITAIEKHADSDSALQRQPILVIAEDMNQAKAQYDVLCATYGDRVQLITGMESDAQRTEALVVAGKPYRITVGTPLLGRGTDIKLENERKQEDYPGLFVIQTYLDTPRNTRQIVGRAARKGDLGKYLAIYSEPGFEFSRFPVLNFSLGLSEKEQHRQIDRLQKILSENAAVERHYMQEVDDIQQVLLRQFDAWKSVLLGGETEDRRYLETEIFTLRAKLIQQVSKTWSDRLSESDHDNKYKNSYIRRNGKDGVLETSELDKALTLFETDNGLGVPKVWSMIQKELINSKLKLKSRSRVDDVRFEYLEHDNIANDLQYRKLKLQHKRLDMERLCRVNEERTKRIVELALDPDGAVLAFDGEQMEPSEKLRVTEAHAKTYLDAIFQQSHKLQLVDDKKAPISTRIELLVGALLEPKSYKQRVQFQSAAIECLELYNRVQGTIVGLHDFENTASNACNIKQQIDRIESVYKKDVVKPLAVDLIDQLSWVKESSSFYRTWMEHSKVTRAALAIVKASEAVQNAYLTSNKAQQHIALRALNKSLNHHQVMLSNMWYYFPFGECFFGYKDTRKVIADALNQCTMLVRIDPDSALQLQELQYDGYEAGKCQAYLTDFTAQLRALQVNDEGWKEVLKQVELIQKANDGLAVVDELLHYLNTSEVQAMALVVKPTLISSFSSLFTKVTVNPVQVLIKTLTAAHTKIRQDDPEIEPTRARLFMSKKEASLTKVLSQYNALKVTINPGVSHRPIIRAKLNVADSTSRNDDRDHAGFDTYFDVVIHGQVPIADFATEYQFQHDSRRGTYELELKDVTAEIGRASRDLDKAKAGLHIAQDLLQTIKSSAKNNKPNKTPTMAAIVTMSAFFQRNWSNLRGHQPVVKKSVDVHPISGHWQKLRNNLKQAVAIEQDAALEKVGHLPNQIETLEATLKTLRDKECILKERIHKSNANIMFKRFDNLDDLLSFETALKRKYSAIGESNEETDAESVANDDSFDPARLREGISN